MSVVCVSVGFSREPTKMTAGPIEVPFGVLTPVSLKNQLLGAGQDLHWKRHFGGTYLGMLRRMWAAVLPLGIINAETCFILISGVCVCV